MQGISNRLSNVVESMANEEAVENFEQRIKDTGRVPGTHTLGEEFKTTNKKTKKK